MKEATYVAISTQKGGAGKTTLTVLVQRQSRKTTDISSKNK